MYISRLLVSDSEIIVFDLCHRAYLSAKMISIVLILVNFPGVVTAVIHVLCCQSLWMRPMNLVLVPSGNYRFPDLPLDN